MVLVYPNEVLNYIFHSEGCPMILCLKRVISVAMYEMKNHQNTVHGSPQKKVEKGTKS